MPNTNDVKSNKENNQDKINAKDEKKSKKTY